MKFFIETSWASLNHFGEELCGDKVEIVKRDNGILLVLSDGLGSGVKANILASLTSKIISSMVSAGADISDVVETIASTLPVCKVRNVAYSTFTLMQVDKDGNAYFVEFDNPSLVLMREGKRVCSLGRADYCRQANSPGAYEAQTGRYSHYFFRWCDSRRRGTGAELWLAA